MNRRDFVKILLASAVAEAVDVEKLLWIPKPIITVPTLPVGLYGVPYHMTDASTGQWLGILREATTEFSKKIDVNLFERDAEFWKDYI